MVATMKDVKSSSFTRAMKPDEFCSRLKALDLSVYASAKILGISLRQAQRYASWEQPVGQPVARYLRLLDKHIRGLRDGYRMTTVQIKHLEADISRLHAHRIYKNRKDLVARTIQDLKEHHEYLEALLLDHPSGLKISFKRSAEPSEREVQRSYIKVRLKKRSAAN